MRFLVGLYFFTFMHGYAESSGEYCHGWADSHNIWHIGFQCPEPYDSHDAKYCCGSCALRYCCTEAEARLDQSSCVQENVFELENNDNTNIAPEVPTYLPFVIVVGTFLSFVLVGIIVSICCCHCLKPKEQGHQNGSPAFQTNLLDSSLSPESMTPSRESSSSSSSHARSTMTRQPCTFGTEVNVNMFGPLSDGYQDTSHAPQYVPYSQPHAPFYQPYMNYGIPPEHTLLMAPTFADHQMYGPSLIHHPIPQPPMHTEQLITGVAI